MDVRRVKRGDEALWLAAVRSLVAEADRDAKLVKQAELTLALDDDRCYLYLALLGDVPIGLLSAYRFPDVESGGEIVYLYDIEVHRDNREKGVGKALVNGLISVCERDGVSLLWAGTDTENVPARKTFETTGAVLEGETYVEYEWNLSAKRTNNGNDNDNA